MGFPILARYHLYIESGLRSSYKLHCKHKGYIRDFIWTLFEPRFSYTFIDKWSIHICVEWLHHVATKCSLNVNCSVKRVKLSDATHYCDAIMCVMASQITSLAIVYSTVCSDADQRKHQCSASLAFVRGIHRWPVNSPHKWPVTRKMFPFDDVIMGYDFLLPPKLDYFLLFQPLNFINKSLVFRFLVHIHYTKTSQVTVAFS